MTAKGGISILLAGSVLMAHSALADNYDFEIGLSYDRTQLDFEQTITTNVGTIF